MDVPNPNDVLELVEGETEPLYAVTELGGEYYLYIGKTTAPSSELCEADVIWIEYDTIVQLYPERFVNTEIRFWEKLDNFI